MQELVHLPMPRVHIKTANKIVSKVLKTWSEKLKVVKNSGVSEEQPRNSVTLAKKIYFPKMTF